MAIHVCSRLSASGHTLYVARDREPNEQTTSLADQFVFNCGEKDYATESSVQSKPALRNARGAWGGVGAPGPSLSPPEVRTED